MTTLREAAQQALEALEELNGWQSLAPPVASQVGRHAAISLRAALEQTVQEPLSDEELDRLWREPMSADWEHREYARAIEAAHGIKENT
jgi:hypothetical protein